MIPAMTPDFMVWLISNWARCEGYLQRAVDRAEGAFDLDHVWREVVKGDAQFWPGENTACVTRIEEYPSGIKAVLGWVAGGDDLDELKDIEARISVWAKGMGCDRFEIIGRRGWLRALDGYREGSTLLIKDL
jgi:hypothetical protein